MLQKIKVSELSSNRLDIGDELPKAISQIDLKSSEILVDFTEYLVDYPSTAKALDILFNHISNSDGDRALIIKVDFQTSVRMILQFLFFGSQFLKITAAYRLSEMEIKSMLNQKLNEHRIKLLIHYGESILELGYSKSL